jgi:hypothetical protein
MVISAIGRMAAKAAIKKISNASAKKAQAFMRADKKTTDTGYATSVLCLEEQLEHLKE